MANSTSTFTTFEAVTEQHDFCQTTTEGENLFSVRAGIPLSRAFDKLSALMSSSIASIEVLACEEEADSIPGALWQSVHLMNFTYALVQSMHKGHNASKRDEWAMLKQACSESLANRGSKP